MAEVRRHLVEHFQRFDTAGIGKIKKEALESVLIGVGQSQKEAEGLLMQYGASAGMICYRHFVDWVLAASAAPSRPPRATAKERLGAVFQACDAHRTGRISRGALMEAMRQISPGEAWAELQAVYAGCMRPGEDPVDYQAFIDALFEGDAQASVAEEELDRLSYYASPKSELVTVLRRLDPEVEEAAPRFATMEEFREAHADNEPLLRQLRNRVLICATCKKPNAYTMKSCNACDSPLSGIEESVNDNIFMGFIYGVAKGRFPYAISTRAETEDYLAFDDPLGVTVCHLCVIPTSTFCPDIRFLFADPARGLRLVEDLMEVGRQAALTYWSDKAFVEAYWPGREPPETTEDMENLCVLGFNFPPSMFQLHLQFQHGPLFPFHAVQLERGSHYNHGRFYPLEYVRAALALGDAVRMDVDDDTRIEDIVAKVKDQGLDYDTMHKQMIDKGKSFAKKFPIWHRRDFEHTVTNGKVYSNDTGEVVPDLNPAELQRKDNAAMRNYAKPKCSMYRFMKSPSEVKHFLEGA